MKKVIKLTEQQLNNVIMRSVEEQGEYPEYLEHWKSKFEKSVEILLKMGISPDILIKKIQEAHKINIK
jgi:hypothetical protein